MAPWCIHISCLERVARSGSGRDSVRGLVGAMDAELSRPDWVATLQSGRKQVQSRVCTPSFMQTKFLINTCVTALISIIDISVCYAVMEKKYYPICFLRELSQTSAGMVV